MRRSVKFGLLPSPAGPFSAVLQNDPGRLQVLANLIGQPIIFVELGLLTLDNQLLDLLGPNGIGTHRLLKPVRRLLL